MRIKLLFGQLILTTLLAKEGSGAVVAPYPCTENGTNKQTCKLKCNQSDGSCSESIVSEACSCDGEGSEETFTYYYENGILTSGVGKRKRRQAEDSVCNNMGFRCTDCKQVQYGGSRTAQANKASFKSC